MAISQEIKDQFDTAYDNEVSTQSETDGRYAQKLEWVDGDLTLSVTEYLGSAGNGWVLIGKANDGEDDYTTAKGHGSESRDKEWTKVTVI